MNRKILEKYIETLIPLSGNVLIELAEKFEYMEIEKGDFLIKEYEISKEACFLESGIVRSFINDSNGNEVTTNIFLAPYFANDFLSFFRQQPTSENFQAISDCKIWKISYKDSEISFHEYPEFREFGRLMLVSNYSVLQERMVEMIKDSAETRYLKLMKTHPDIFQYVPLKVIASYLGITDTSLSRIRKKIVC